MKSVQVTLFRYLFINLILIGFVSGQNAYQVYFNEIRANDASTDDAEFIELVAPAGTDLSGFKIEHYNGSESIDGALFTHTIGAFTVPDDGVTDNAGNPLGFYVLSLTGNSALSNADEVSSDNLQNGEDGVILYDSEDNILDAVAWEGPGDLTTDDPGTVTTSGSTSENNYLHVTVDDDAGDNSLQAPDDVLSDDGTGWALFAATPGQINQNQNDGDMSLPVNLVAFNALLQDDHILVKWRTASEVDNLGFELYRSFEAHNDYQLLDSYRNNPALKGKHNSSAANDYQFADYSVETGKTYFYKLADVDVGGKRTWHAPIEIHVSEAQDFEKTEPFTIRDFRLYPNFPNPFNPSTTIVFDIPELNESSVDILLAIYNVSGKRVRTIYNEKLESNRRYRFRWDGRDERGNMLTSGIYIAQLKTDGFSKAIKMCLMR